MYTVSVSETFLASHYLTVPDAGYENKLHSHRYTVELTLEGSSLNEHEYLVDIDDMTHHLQEVVGEYENETLNERAEIPNNPSAERLARALFDRLTNRIETPQVDRLVVSVQEDDVATVTFADAI